LCKSSWPSLESLNLVVDACPNLCVKVQAATYKLSLNGA
jgi:hypothetical protein